MVHHLTNDHYVRYDEVEHVESTSL